MNDTTSARWKQLDEALRGAELLIEYSSRNALTPNGIDDAELQALTVRTATARTKLASTGWTSEEEAQFFADFRVLSRAFLPVTVGSICDSREDTSGTYRQYIWWGAPITPAAAIVRRFTLCTLVALVTLLAVQIVWLVGYDLTDRIRTLQKEQLAAATAPALADAAASEQKAKTAQEIATDSDKAATTAEQAANAARAAAHSPGAPADAAQNLKDAEAAAKTAREKADSAKAAAADAARLAERSRSADRKRQEDDQNREMQIQVISQMLTLWTDLFRGMPLFSRDLEAGTDDLGYGNPGMLRNNQNLVISSIVVTILQTYCLPLLYGFLGTCAYVLRQLTIETRARTFRRDEEIGYWLRIFLGILAGLAVGWFLRPEASQDGFVRGLTPFALSFLAGYSVEVLFAGMDRLVAAFGSGASSGKAN